MEETAKLFQIQIVVDSDTKIFILVWLMKGSESDLGHSHVQDYDYIITHIMPTILIIQPHLLRNQM